MATGVDNLFLEISTKNGSNKFFEDPSKESGSHSSTLTQETSNVCYGLLDSSPADLEPADGSLPQENEDRYANCYAFLKRDYDARLYRPLRPRPVLVTLDDNPNIGYLGSMERATRQRTFWEHVIDWYFKLAGNFRNSKYIYILPLLYSALFITSIAMGLTFVPDCPGLVHVPYVGVVTGIYSLIFMAIWAVYSFRLQRGKRCRGKLFFAFALSMAVFAFITAIDVFLVFHIRPSYKPSDENYCNQTFYRYSVYKQLVKGVALIFAGIVYLPPYRHDLCCDVCIGPRSGRSAFPMVPY